jgi:hypothetical protein
MQMGETGMKTDGKEADGIMYADVKREERRQERREKEGRRLEGDRQRTKPVLYCISKELCLPAGVAGGGS